MNDLEARTLEEIARRRDDVVELCSELIRYDTSARGLRDRAGDEAALQAHLARRLSDAGLEIELWVPEPEAAAAVTVLPGFSFDGRPQLIARRPGSGGGRSLLLNGHVDVVPPGPEDAWTAPPRSARLRDGRLYGLGACDMKGGVAAMVVAVEALAAVRAETAGDLLVSTVTDEESTGAGTAAVVARGIPVDAAVVPEPTGLDVWTGSRGAGIVTITVPGRTGHAGLAREDSDPAHAVNAIDATVPLLQALHRLRDDWRSDAALAHPLLGTGDLVPISIEAGDWLVTHPSSCRLRCHVSFTPSQADDRGLGRPVRRELEERVAAAAAQDPWLRANPPRIEWSAGVPTAEVPADHPIVETLRRAAADLGRRSGISSRTTWYDGVTLTRSGVPTVACGPGDIAHAHAVDEFVPVDHLVATAQCLALTALRFCGPSRWA